MEMDLTSPISESKGVDEDLLSPPISNSQSRNDSISKARAALRARLAQNQAATNSLPDLEMNDAGCLLPPTSNNHETTMTSDGVAFGEIESAPPLGNINSLSGQGDSARQVPNNTGIAGHFQPLELDPHPEREHYHRKLFCTPEPENQPESHRPKSPAGESNPEPVELFHRPESGPEVPSENGNIGHAKTNQKRKRTRRGMSSAERTKMALSGFEAFARGNKNKASRRFTKKPRFNGEGGWRHPDMDTALFHYQLLGAAFMRDRENAGHPPKGGFLCDEMGFGKTIQAIANIVDDRPRDDDANKVTLVVAPAHLTSHWRTQFSQHCKKGVVGRVIEHHARSRLITDDDVDFLESVEVIITTYAEVRMSVPKFDPSQIPQECDKERSWTRFFEENCGPLHRMKFRRIILDEAQEIKNPDSKTSVAVRMLSGDFRWVISGTPLHNGTHELFPYFDFLKIPVGSDFKRFCEECDEDYASDDPWINRILSICMLKRGHEETLFGLPILTLPGIEEFTFKVNFGAAEELLYRKVKEMFIDDAKIFSEEPSRYKKEYRSHLTMLLRLRMFTSHPLLVQNVLKDCLDSSEMQLLRSSIGKNPKPEDIQICDLLDDLVSKQEAWEKSDPAASETRKRQAPKPAAVCLPEFVKIFVAQLKASTVPGVSVEDSIKCMGCKKPPTSVCITSCLHAYCEDCAMDPAMAQNVCECSAAYAEIFRCESIKSLIASNDILDETSTSEAHMGKLSGRPGGRNRRTPKAEEENGIDWVEEAGDTMPGSKLTAITACVKNWFKKCSLTKIVIFTQFLDMVDILASMCEREGWKYVSYTGRVPFSRREKDMFQFREDPLTRILLCSLRTGGTGLDLTAANKCVLVDLWWNNAIEQQAFFRIFRINQTRDVEFVRIAVKHSVDDKLQKLQEQKSKQIDKAMGSDVLSSRMTFENLQTILGVTRDPTAPKGYRFLSQQEQDEGYNPANDPEATIIPDDDDEAAVVSSCDPPANTEKPDANGASGSVAEGGESTEGTDGVEKTGDGEL
ncbi:hypothetical protein FQN52_009338 [Onygenales sp. PD_12]|nr:hypothetical protein FQN52_009338 [Onygenales sp. PD_12]